MCKNNIMLFHLNRFFAVVFVCFFVFSDCIGFIDFCSQDTETCDTGKHLSLAYLSHCQGMVCKCLLSLLLIG